jgi:hypothetical protein
LGPETARLSSVTGCNTLSLLMLYEIAVSKVKVRAKNLVPNHAASEPIEHWVLDSGSGHSYPRPCRTVGPVIALSAAAHRLRSFLSDDNITAVSWNLEEN